MTSNDPGPIQDAWRGLLDVLRGADESFLDPARGEFNETEVAEGYRNLHHILAFATGMYLWPDRSWPEFKPSIKDPVGNRTLGEHPDVHYQWAGIEGGRRYRITGQRGDEAYLSFTVHRGTPGSGMEQWFDSHLNHHDIKVDDDGRFEIILSPEPEGDNWLRCSPDANEIYARAYHLDIDNERTATYRIEPLDAPAPQRLDGPDMARRLGHVTRLVQEMTAAFPQPLDSPNTVGDIWKPDQDAPSRMWSALDNVYSRGVFRLEPDEALVLEGVVVPCDYWGIQLWSPFLASGDRRHQPVSINTSQATLGTNGEFRVAVAMDDPGVPGLDWVSTSGQRQGTFFIRWLAPTRQAPAPTCRLVNRSELAG